MTMMEMAMKWLKSVFVPRFSAADVVALSLILSADFGLIVTALTVAIWCAVVVAVERKFELRNKNGNTPWSEL